MAENLEELLRNLDEPGDPALPSLERIFAGLWQQGFSGIAEIELKEGRIVSLRKKTVDDRKGGTK